MLLILFTDQIKHLKVVASAALAISVVSISFVILIILSWLYRKKRFSIFRVDRNYKTKNKGADISRKDNSKPIEISTIQLPTVDTSVNMREINEIIQNNPRTPQTEYTNLTTNLTTFRNPHARTDPDTPTSNYTNQSARSEPPFNRIPSEDATLEYRGYDNPALAPSPVLSSNGDRNTYSA